MNYQRVKMSKLAGTGLLKHVQAPRQEGKTDRKPGAKKTWASGITAGEKGALKMGYSRWIDGDIDRDS